MPLLYQKHILRAHLKANPQVLFVFGDNVKRSGFRGQAAEMRGEPNAVGIATKWAPSMSTSAMFYDTQLDAIERLVEQDIAVVVRALEDNKIVVWPTDGIGTGLSQLPQNAPKVWAGFEYMRKKLEKIGDW